MCLRVILSASEGSSKATDKQQDFWGQAPQNDD